MNSPTESQAIDAVAIEICILLARRRSEDLIDPVLPGYRMVRARCQWGQADTGTEFTV
jgi:hypothetical protein